MEKITVRKEVKYYFSWEDGISLEKIKKDIEELEKLGADEIDINNDYDYISCTAYTTRLETDEEFEQRKRDVQQQQESLKRVELARLAELKAKYEPNN